MAGSMTKFVEKFANNLKHRKVGFGLVFFAIRDRTIISWINPYVIHMREFIEEKKIEFILKVRNFHAWLFFHSS